jgi:hypothetical protein
MSLTNQQRNELFDQATNLMVQAKQLDTSGRFQEAVNYYVEAIDKLLIVLKRMRFHLESKHHTFSSLRRFYLRVPNDNSN